MKMKTVKAVILASSLLLVAPLVMKAQGPPPPPPPPVNVPIDLGSGILLAVAAGFGAWKIYVNKKKSQEV